MLSSHSIEVLRNEWIRLFSHVVFGLEDVVMKSLRDTVGCNECEPEVIVIVGSLNAHNELFGYVKEFQMRLNLPLVSLLVYNNS